MGSGAKIALVALLILMVVAVAKFVGTGMDDGGQAKKDVAKAAQPAAAPALKANPKVMTSRQTQNTPAPGIAEKSSAPRPAAPTEPKATLPKAELAPTGQTPSTLPVAGRTPEPGPTTPTPGPILLAQKDAKEKTGEVPLANLNNAVAANTKPAGGNLNLDPGRNPGTNPLANPGGAGKVDPTPGKPDSTTPAIVPIGEPKPADLSVFPLTHVVASGESYWKIAEKFYGTGKGYLHQRIADANPGIKLQPGKQIKIPAPPAEAIAPKPAPAPKAAPTTLVATADDEYIVLPGDTLFGLSQKFKCTQKAILAANPSLQYMTLRSGSKIKIPKK
jgi:LysM repeat protein